MPISWEQVVVDSDDPHRLARWWAEALGYVIVHEAPDEVEIRRTPDTLPGLLFGVSPDAKTVKNRLHLDFRPEDQESEVERLVDMGARPVDIGQKDVPWVVLADPEGNEFCVLAPKKAQDRP